MKYIGTLEAAEKHISGKSLKTLHTAVKILQIRVVLQDSVQRFLQNPAKKSCRSGQICKGRKPGMTTFQMLVLSYKGKTFRPHH